MNDNTSKNLKPSTTDTDIPRLALRPNEAAQSLGISERLLWSKTNSGEIPHVRINSAVLYPISSLQSWLNEAAMKGLKADAKQ